MKAAAAAGEWAAALAASGHNALCTDTPTHSTLVRAAVAAGEWVVALKAISQAENLPQLTSLTIGNNSISEAGARAIAEHLPQLTSLTIGNNNIGEAGARAIAESLSLQASLDIGFPSIVSSIRKQK